MASESTSESPDDRPLAPTERRRERARRSGDVVLSHDLVAAVMLACACVVAAVMGKTWWGHLIVYTRATLGSAPTEPSIEQHVRAAGALAAGALVYPLLLMVAGGLAAALAQTRGWAFPSGGGEPSTLSRGVSWRGRVAEVVFAVCRLALLTGVAAATLLPMLSALAGLPMATVTQALGALLTLGERLVVRLVVAMVALGLVDYVWRLVRHRRRLRMTHEEAKREHRETEGHPEQRMERQRLHRELHDEADPFEVGRACLLLVDPGRAAVAVAWSGLGDAPPLLVVRGAGPRACTMEMMARSAGVPVCLDPMLLRALAPVAEGGTIPEVFAGVLARARARARGGAARAQSGGARQ